MIKSGRMLKIACYLQRSHSFIGRNSLGCVQVPCPSPILFSLGGKVDHPHCRPTPHERAYPSNFLPMDGMTTPSALTKMFLPPTLRVRVHIRGVHVLNLYHEEAQLHAPSAIIAAQPSNQISTRIFQWS